MSVDGLSTPIVGECVGEKDGPDGEGVGTFDVGCPTTTFSIVKNNANNADLLIMFLMGLLHDSELRGNSENSANWIVN